MSAEVVWSPLAVSDLDTIWDWIAVENGEPSAADKVIMAILDRVDGIVDFPYATAPLDTVCSIRSDWRFVEAHGYLAFFRVDDNHVYVDHVLSGKSDYLRKLFGVNDGRSYYR